MLRDGNVCVHMLKQRNSTLPPYGLYMSMCLGVEMCGTLWSEIQCTVHNFLHIYNQTSCKVGKCALTTCHHIRGCNLDVPLEDMYDP